MKKLLYFFICLIFAVPLLPAAVNAEDGDTVTVYMDGRSVESDTPAKLVGGVTYISLRAVCQTLGGCSVSWDPASSTATVTAGEIVLSARENNVYIEANGRYLYTGNGIFIENGRIMVPLRIFCESFGAKVSWDSESGSVEITRSGIPIESGSSFYNEGEVYWLSRIIFAEAGSEPFSGQIAVGNVVLNRVASDEFPNSIYEVIFDREYGVQFTPVANGTVYNTPSTQSIIAAKLCFDGADTANGSLYFLDPVLAVNKWVVNNRRYCKTIGTHDFYY